MIRKVYKQCLMTYQAWLRKLTRLTDRLELSVSPTVCCDLIGPSHTKQASVFATSPVQRKGAPQGQMTRPNESPKQLMPVSSSGVQLCFVHACQKHVQTKPLVQKQPALYCFFVTVQYNPGKHPGQLQDDG